MHKSLCLCRSIGIFYDPRLNGDRARPSPRAPFHFPRSPLAEFGVGTQFFADGTSGCHVGRAWRDRVAAGVPVAHERAGASVGTRKPRYSTMYSSTAVRTAAVPGYVSTCMHGVLLFRIGNSMLL